MLALAFLNPMLLWALPLAAVPIVIHLLNRRRFRRVPWAAMEFLLKAMKRNRKRLRMEQWLVLLLRTLAVLLLAMLVSRPQIGGGALFGTRTHHVVILDDSASMLQRSGSTVLFERARSRVRGLADDLSRRRSGDLFSVVRTSRPSQPDLWAQRIGPDSERRIGALTKEFACTDGAQDLGAALQAAIGKAREVREAGRTEFYVASDQRAHDWLAADDKPQPRVQAALASLDPSVEHVTVLGVAGSPANVGVVDVRLLDRMLVVGVPATFAVDVRNHGLDPSPPSQVAIEVDGRSRVAQPVPQLAPGERVAIPFAHTFHQQGPHHVEATLEAADTHAIDDRRSLALDVAPRSRALLVDGDPDTDEGETFFLQAAFELGGEATSGIEVQIVTDAALAGVDLQPFDVIWLCNVQSLDGAMAERIEAFVGAGGGLVVACGPQVDAARYGELLWKGGAGVLPLPIGDVAGDPDRPERAVLVTRDHPICEGVAEPMELLTNRALLVRRWLTLGEPPGHAASIVARIRDAEGPPLLATRTFGESGGRTALLAITADRFWSNLPSTHLFLVLTHQVHKFAARRADFAAANLTPAGHYRLEIDVATHRPDATLRALGGDGDERTFTAVRPKTVETGETDEEAHLVLDAPMSELRQLGAYAVVLTRHDGLADERRIARNAPVEESRLAGFAPATFARSYPVELHGLVTFANESADGARDAGDGEVWRWLAAALVAGLLLESLLAWRFGRH